MKKLKELRESKNMTQQQFAEKLGVSRTTVTMWELGKNTPSVSVLLRVVQILGCTVDDLLGRG